MVSKVDDLPCMGCPVLAICVTKKIINCEILLDFLTKYQRLARFPMWGQMLSHVRETLRGNWCVVGSNDQITFLEKDRESMDVNGKLNFQTYEQISSSYYHKKIKKQNINLKNITI